MLLKDYVAPRGMRSELAASLGVPPQLLGQWANEIRQAPAERCPDIERATGGAVRCEELRPDVDWSVLRGANPPQTITEQAQAATNEVATAGEGANA